MSDIGLDMYALVLNIMIFYCQYQEILLVFYVRLVDLLITFLNIMIQRIKYYI